MDIFDEVWSCESATFSGSPLLGTRSRLLLITYMHDVLESSKPRVKEIEVLKVHATVNTATAKHYNRSLIVKRGQTEPNSLPKENTISFKAFLHCVSGSSYAYETSSAERCVFPSYRLRTLQQGVV